MKDKYFEKWTETRKKGRWRYVITNGVFGWGLFMLIATAFINDPFSEGFLSRAAIVHYIVWPTGGFMFGLAMWWQTERDYKKYLLRLSN